MVGNPDTTRVYLRPYLTNLAIFCRDAKTSYSMLINANNSIVRLDIDHPRNPRTNPNFENELTEYNNMRKYHESVINIAIHSFANNCAIIYKILWPTTTDCNGNIIQKRDKRKKDLDEFFPQNKFVNMKKQFRNFLEHTDERLDHWDTSSKHHNIAIGTMGDSANLGQNFTLWMHFHPSTLTITFYDEKQDSNTVDLKAMLSDIEEIHQSIPKAMDKIMDSRPNWHDFMLDI
jgi:hypothetical protein